MLKKFGCIAFFFVLMFTLLVISVHSAKFSSDNYTQYVNGFYTSSNEMIVDTTTTNVDGVDYITYAKVNGASTRVLSSDLNPIAYKNSKVNEGPIGKFAHMRFYLSAFSDEWRTTMKTIQLRMDKDGTGSSRNTFILDGANSQAYPEYTNSGTYIDRRNRIGVWTMGKDYNTNSNGVVPNDEDFHKIDLISDLNGVKARTTYMFIDGEFMGCYYDSSMPTSHFYGIVLRVLKNTKLRTNCYMAAKFDADRIGHREYYDTADYKVTFEDVLQDAGLGNEVDDSAIIYQTSQLSNYMPGVEHNARIYSEEENTNISINSKVSYDGTTAIIKNSSDNFIKTADMLAGMIPQRNGFGLGYVNYTPYARFIRISYDQTIIGTGTSVEYDLCSSNISRAFQLWNSGGKLVVGMHGDGSNVTTIANYEDTNHIDWVIDLIEKTEYVFVNRNYVSSGDISTDRIQNIIIQMKGNDASLMLDNWTMTLYKNEKNFDELTSEITGTVAYWVSGEDKNAIVVDAEQNKLAVLATAKVYEGVKITDSFANAKIITALYDKDNRFIDMNIKDFVDEKTIGSQPDDNIFDINRYSVIPGIVKTFLITVDSLVPWALYNVMEVTVEK